jgi:hypothetical protein
MSPSLSTTLSFFHPTKVLTTDLPNLTILVAHWEATDASASVPSHHAQCTHESART